MLEDIRNNITKLVALYEGEKQRCEDLSNRLTQSEAAVEACKEQIKDLTSQIDSLNLSSAFSAAGPRPEARATLDSIIAEIDKCIRFLEK